MGRPVLKRIFSAFKKLFGSQNPSSKRKQKNRRKRSSRRPARRVRVKAGNKGASVNHGRRKKTSSAFLSRKLKPHPRENPGDLAGEVTHFFPRIQVVVVKIKKGTLSMGDKIRVRGNATDFIQSVGSLQIESVDVKSVRSGQLVGLKVLRPARVGDKIYKMPR